MKSKNVIVVHEFDGKKYFEALVALSLEGKIENLLFRECSVVKKSIKDFIRNPKSLVSVLNRAITNAIFRFKVPFIHDETVIVAMPPWDFRMVWYGLLARNNRVIYQTSWPCWDIDQTPRNYGIFNRLFFSAWNLFLNHPNVQTVCVTSGSSENFSRIFPNALVSVIPHVVSAAFTITESKPLNGKLSILYVGELIEKKGIKLIPEIIKELEFEPEKFSFVGSGDLFGFLQELSSTHQFHLFGQIRDRSKLAEIYSEHQILLVPSLRTNKWEELFGMVIVEAMAAGLAVIASSHVGPRSIIQTGVDGFLVSEGQYAEFAQVMNSLAKDPIQLSTIVDNARRTAEKYSINSVSKMWLDIISK